MCLEPKSVGGPDVGSVYLEVDLTYRRLASFEANSAIFSPLLALTNSILSEPPILNNSCFDHAIFFCENKTKVMMVPSLY